MSLWQFQLDDSLDVYCVGFHSSVAIISVLFAIFSIRVYMSFLHKKAFWKRFGAIELNIALGGIGRVTLRPTIEDIQIAHRIWIQLVTRKAAIEVDENDVIGEVYDSWHALFLEVRALIGAIPANLIKNEDTRKIITISVETLNNGLRPHLTKWQAKYRSWHQTAKEKDKESTPQDLQKKFPEYEALMQDMLRVNRELIAYAAELKRMINDE